ncbi:MAG: hypothetical protein JWO74_3455, partial [Solirubrobacterales bacterium]|nr:hypothetical protein [Solirubrobacterales bacterium]
NHGYSEYSGKENDSRVLVDWRTGSRVDEATDPFGTRALVDLDRPSGHRRLCGPLRRLPGSLLVDGSRFSPTTLWSPWVLQHPDGDTILEHCGSRRARRIRASAVVSLVDGVLVVQQHNAGVTLQRLDSGRVFRGTVPGVSAPSRTTVAAGRRFAFATVPTFGPGPTAVLRALLPR